MSIADKLNTLQMIKANIKTAIENKGVDVGDAPFTDYASKIDDIEGGSSEGGGGTVKFTPTASTFTMNNCEIQGEVEVDCKNMTYAPSFNYTVFSNIKGPRITNSTNFTNSTGMYRYSNVVEPYLFDTSNAVNMSSMFFHCENLETIPQYITSKVTNMDMMFYYCKKLHTIPLLDMSVVTSTTSMFTNCNELVNISGFQGLQVDIDLKNCEKLTRESMLNVFNTIGEANSTITIHQNVADRLTDEDKAIATNKGWTITA